MDTLEVLRGVIVLIHLTGFALLFGAWAVEVFARRVAVTRVMHVGLTVALLAGLVLAAPWGVDDLNYVKIGVKLVVVIVIGALLGIGAGRQRREGAVPVWLFWGVGVLTFLNAAIAVLW